MTYLGQTTIRSDRPQALISRPTAFAAKDLKSSTPYPFHTENRIGQEVYYEGFGPVIQVLYTWAAAHPASESGMTKFPYNWFAPPTTDEAPTSWGAWGWSRSGVWVGAELDKGTLHSFVAQLGGPADDPRNDGFWLTGHLPKGFKSFSSSGIVLWNKNKITGSIYTGRISIEVMDPSTGERFESSPPSGAIYHNVSDSEFNPIQIPGSLLNAHNFQEKQMIKMFVRTTSIDEDISYVWRKFGLLEVHWDGD